MNFVKASIYHAELTEQGVKESETETRDDATLEKEKLIRSLPEFTRNENYRSLSEQLSEADEDRLEHEREAGIDSSRTTENSSYAPAKVTEEEYEFMEALKEKERATKAARQKEEDAALHLFAEAKKKALLEKSASNRAAKRPPTGFGAIDENPKAAKVEEKKKSSIFDSSLVMSEPVQNNDTENSEKPEVSNDGEIDETCRDEPTQTNLLGQDYSDSD